MDAPTYPPSKAYVALQVLSQPMSTRTSSLADFLANPRALAIIRAEAPGFDLIVKTPMLEPHLGNMSPRDMVAFGALKAEQLDKVDARLKAEGITQGGQL